MNPPVANAEFDPVLLELFRTELETHTRVLEQGLIQAETAQTTETLEPLMRAAHSIKGAARMLGLDAAVRLAHAMEEVLVAAQRGTAPLTPPRIDVLLRGNDVFLRAAASGAASVPSELQRQAGDIDRLIAALASAPAAAPLPPAVKSTAAPEPPRASAGDQAVRVNAESLNRLVGMAGECLVQTRLTRPLSAGLQRIQQRQASAATGLERTLTLLRDDDVSAARTELEHSLEQFRSARDLTAKYLLDFADWTRRLEVLVNPLYAEAVASRMRPFGDGTHGYARMVRDLARDLGKNVDFDIDGAATPVDREILDRLESPLTHLLRNALDHGIETPAGRAARGKPPAGKLVLSAHQVSGMLRITVAEDGAGIDTAELRRRIAAAGYVSEEIAKDLGDAEVLEFLFLPGFSTAHTVTEVSGRGVGLDVVHSAVRAVGGSVRVQSTPGAGTAIEMQLPLTLSIVRALLVEIGGEIYAMPLTRIDRLLRTTPEELQVLEDRQFCTVDGQHVGILDARQVLHAAAGSRPANFCVIVISDRLSR